MKKLLEKNLKNRKRILHVQRGLSLFLVLNLLIGFFIAPIQANIQIPVESVTVENVYYIVGENIVTREPIISPTMTVGWKDPDNWAPAIDPADIHTPDFYDVEVNNVTTGKDIVLKVNEGSESFNNRLLDVHQQTNLDTGSLYEIKVKPYHYHEVNDALDLAPVSGIAKKAYAITDLQVGFESDEDSITVVWDNIGIPEFQYRIVYALGDFSSQTKQALIDNKEGDVSGLTIDSDDVVSFYDPITKRNKLSYTISQNIYPGQVYSVMVEPLVDYYEGIAVTRNRNYPVINNVSTNIKLSYSEEGDQLRLQWTIPASFQVGSNNEQYELVETKLLRFRDGQGQSIAIFNGSAGAIGYYTLTKPVLETGYQLELTYKAVNDQSKPAIEPVSNLLVYLPSQVEVIPTKPIIPELLSKDILNDLKASYSTEAVRDILAENYLVPGSTYLGNLDELFTKNITYHFDSDDKAVNLAWSAFRRIDIDQTSPTYNQYITDLNTYYDIWMTNSYSSLAYATKVLSDQRFSSLDTSSLIKSESGTIVGFHMKLDGYYNEDSGNLETIRPNQIYYMKVVAKKKIGDQEITSEPSIVTFYYTDAGDVSVPPLVTKPPLRLKEEDSTTTSLTIAWKENWWEVIDPLGDIGDPLSEWSNEVWVKADGTISTMPLDGAKYFPVFEGQDQVTLLQSYLNQIGAGITLQFREIDLGKDPFGVSNIYYKFLRINYTDVQAKIAQKKLVNPDYSFSEYFDEMVKNDKDGTVPLNWRRIEASINPDDQEEMLYKEKGLLPNTSYLFVLYPYRVIYDNVELDAHYPTPIVVATEPVIDEIYPNPTVPSMYITNYTDRSLSLSWKYNTDFTYEILYSTDDDITKAVAYDIALPSNTNDPDYPRDGEYYEVTIPDLFPDTGYYFYIRSTQPSTGTKSLWSNPVFGKTADVPIPLAPRGVGIPPVSLMKVHGYDDAVTEDFITISWLKDVNDTDTINDGMNVKIYYSYILEAANNEKFIGPTYIVSGEDDSIIPENVEQLEKNLIKINNLVSNRHYYFRMKTRVTVVGTGDDQLIVKESEYYSSTVKIITISSDNEYDSSSDPALEILPSQNFELIYDKDKEELLYRFRDNSIDANGNADNNVDQRLISDLIKRNLYTYDVDVSGYDNKPVTTRKIQIPYSIIEAFDSYEIELNIDAGNLLLNIPHDALLSEVNRQKNQYGVAPMIEIAIGAVDNFYDPTRMPTSALTTVSIPQEMVIKVKSNKITKKLSYSDVPINIGVSTSSRYQVYGKNPIVYAKGANSTWSKLAGEYNQTQGAFMLSTKNIGSYGVFLMEGSNEIKSTKPSHWSESYKKTIDGLYTVKGLTNYNPDSKVKEDEMMNIVYSMVMNEELIDFSKYVSNEQINALYFAGIKVDKTKGGTTINREEAIAMMMKTLEIRDGLTLAADTNMLAKVKSDTLIDIPFKNYIAKAATIGLVSDLSKLRPNDTITYGELFALWARAEGL